IFSTPQLNAPRLKSNNNWQSIRLQNPKTIPWPNTVKLFSVAPPGSAGKSSSTNPKLNAFAVIASTASVAMLAPTSAISASKKTAFAHARRHRPDPLQTGYPQPGGVSGLAQMTLSGRGLHTRDVVV